MYWVIVYGIWYTILFVVQVLEMHRNRKVIQ